MGAGAAVAAEVVATEVVADVAVAAAVDVGASVAADAALEVGFEGVAGDLLGETLASTAGEAGFSGAAGDLLTGSLDLASAEPGFSGAAGDLLSGSIDSVGGIDFSGLTTEQLGQMDQGALLTGKANTVDAFGTGMAQIGQGEVGKGIGTIAGKVGSATGISDAMAWYNGLSPATKLAMSVGSNLATSAITSGSGAKKGSQIDPSLAGSDLISQSKTKSEDIAKQFQSDLEMQSKKFAYFDYPALIHSQALNNNDFNPLIPTDHPTNNSAVADVIAKAGAGFAR